MKLRGLLLACALLGSVGGAQAQNGALATVFGLKSGDAVPAEPHCRTDAGRCRLAVTTDSGQEFSRVFVQGNALAGVCSVRAEHEIPADRPAEVARYVDRLLARWRGRFGEPLWGQEDLSKRLATDAASMTPGNPAYDGRGAGNTLLHALWRLEDHETRETGVRSVRVQGHIGPSGEPRAGGASANTVFDTARIQLTVQFAQAPECVTACDPAGQRLLPDLLHGALRWRCLSERGAALVPGAHWGWSTPELGSYDYVLAVGPRRPEVPAAERASWHFTGFEAAELDARAFEDAVGKPVSQLKAGPGELPIRDRIVLSGRTSLGDRFRIYLALAAESDAQGRRGYGVVVRCDEGACSQQRLAPQPFVLSHLSRARLTALFNALQAEQRRLRITSMAD